MTLFGNAINIDASAGQAEPLRPVHDGVFITSTLDSTSPFPRVSKPLLISSVQNDAAPTIYGTFPDPLPESEFGPIVNATFGSPRTGQILASPDYQTAPLVDGTPGDARSQLEELGTDYLWKCSSWTFARNWIANGGTAYVGLYAVGATYPGNDQIPFCTIPGSVCHQDDIEIVVSSL